MSEQNSFDIVIIGGGPGGYVAAIRAAQLGLRVAVVERENLGGVCLNWGCIPTKALLRSAEIKHYLDHAKDYGLSVDNVQVDLPAIIKRSRGVAAQLNSGVKHLLKKNKVSVFMGTGTLLDRTKVQVRSAEDTSVELSAQHIIIATGARARELGHLQADGARVWTYRHAMTPDALPTSLLVIGSGAIGVEFASFFSDLGSKVTIVEMQERILPVEDEEVSAFMHKALSKQGMTIKTKAQVKALKSGLSGVEAEIDTAGVVEKLAFDRVIIAIGIAPNTEDLGLEALGVATDRGHIITDGYGRTNVPTLWAIGDVTGAPWLAHKASHEGVTAVEMIAKALGKGADLHPHPLDRNAIPGCTYSRPQVASLGLTEAGAKAAGHSVKVGRFPFVGNGKAIALGESEGFIKTVFDAKTGELLGAHMVGAEVTELIQGYTIAKTLETTEEALKATIFPHPTLSEMMHEAVLAADGEALHY